MHARKSKNFLLTAVVTLLFGSALIPQTSWPAESEPIFDWTDKSGQEEIDHPLHEKGLIRIDKNRKYIYKVNESEQKNAVAVRVGFAEFNDLENPEESGQVGSTFDENYDNSNSPMVLIDYEWQLFRTPIGKLGVRMGGGVFYAQGNGHFVSTTNQSKTPREVFTFFAVPVNLGATYRMQIWDQQLIVPYGEGGLTAIGFAEIRDDDKGPKFGGAPAGYFAAGAAFNLTYFDNLSRIMLDREYGINRVYLTGEYRAIIGLSQNYDFTSDFINGGIMMEF